MPPREPNPSAAFLTLNIANYNMLHSITSLWSAKFLVILHMNPAICGASEEDLHRVLGGSFTYERRLSAFYFLAS